MIFTGHVKPFDLPYHDKFEITNECLIVMNAYFMIIFSDFVPDPHAKYLMGYANFTVIVMMVVINLIILMSVKGYRGIR